jgi:hypothetical protein
MADVVRYWWNYKSTNIEIFQREVGKTQRYMYIPTNLISKADTSTICEIITNGGNIANSCVVDVINGGATYYFTWKVIESLKRAEAKVYDEVVDFLRSSKASAPIITASNTTFKQLNPFLFKIGDTFEDTSTKDMWTIEDIIKSVDNYVIKKERTNGLININRNVFEDEVKNGRVVRIFVNQPAQNITAITNKQYNNQILNELQDVKKGDVIKIIRKKDGSIYNEVQVMSFEIGTKEWYIKVDNKGQSADLYLDYWEEVLKTGDLEVQILKKGQAQASTFKVGDKVKIKKDSIFYGDGTKNPKDVIGEITEIETEPNGLPIRVTWIGGAKNAYEEQDLELLTPQQAQVPSVDKLPVYCLRSGFRKVGYIKDVIGEIDSFTNARRWKVDFKDGTNAICYRQEFFVEGDVLELKKGFAYEVKILVSKIEDYEIIYYAENNNQNGWSNTLISNPPSAFLDYEISVLDPIEDIASVALLNSFLIQQQAKQIVYAVDLEWKKIMEVTNDVQKMTSPKDDFWVLYDKSENESYGQNRREFFVEGDIVKFTYRKDKTVYINARINNIDFIGDRVDWLNIDDNLVGSFYINGLIEAYIIEIVEFFNLRELFDQPILIPKDDIGATQLTPSTSELDEIEQAKKDLGQLLFMRNLLSPIDFEQKIEVTQLIDEKQKLINELNFKGIEEKMAKDQFFDDLFEQSFTPIQHEYEDIYNLTSQEIDFFTPNGARTQLSFEINEIIRTPQFKEWFGDWELAYIYKDADALELDCSKVLTPNFEPRVVWHGTGKEFSYFIFDKFPAAYFAVNREYSQFFADLQGGGDGYVIPFFLNIRNPLDLTHFETNNVSAKDFFDYMYLMTGLTMEQLDVNPIFLSGSTPLLQTWMYIRNNPKMLKKIADTKIYDGIHFYETNPNIKDVSSAAHKTEAYITFSSHQCKIADPNRGMLLFASLKSFLLEKGGKI